MSRSDYKRLTAVLGGACVALLVLCGGLFWGCGALKTRLAFATEQMQVFEQMRRQALLLVG